VRYRLSGVHLSPEGLKNEWKNPARLINFHAFMEEMIKERKPDLAYGTWKHHKSFAKKIKEFSPKLHFADITPEYLEKFQRWMKAKKGNDINTIHGTMRMFRSYLNIAKRRKVIDTSPFTQIKLKKAKVNRVFLTNSELKQFYQAYQSGKLSDAKKRILRHFLFMCYTGLRISDFLSLKKDQVSSDNILMYVPVKTQATKRDMVSIPLNRFALQMIRDEESTGELIFDTISEQKMNKYIKEIAASIGINKNVSNHSARHTFATLFLESGGNLAALQKLLGHSNIRETMEYVHVTKKMLVDGIACFEKMLE
jgi:site-specific recombinase XerD